MGTKDYVIELEERNAEILVKENLESRDQGYPDEDQETIKMIDENN